MVKVGLVPYTGRMFSAEYFFADKGQEEDWILIAKSIPLMTRNKNFGEQLGLLNTDERIPEAREVFLVMTLYYAITKKPFISGFTRTKNFTLKGENIVLGQLLNGRIIIKTVQAEERHHDLGLTPIIMPWFVPDRRFDNRRFFIVFYFNTDIIFLWNLVIF